MAKKRSKKSISLTLRNYFIAGVVVLIPIGFTLYLTKILIGISSNLIPKNINLVLINKIGKVNFKNKYTISEIDKFLSVQLKSI